MTWSADWPQALEAGWGLFATVIAAAAFVLVAVRPRATPSAVEQLAVAVLALALSVVVAEEPRLLWFAAGLALQTAIVHLLSRGAPAFRVEIARPLLLLGVLGVVPWLVYASRMWAANREDRADADLTIGIDHYSMQGALGASLALLPLLAAVESRARPFSALCTGAAAFYLALVSLAWPEAAGGLSEAWSLAALAWALALLAAAATARRRAGSATPRAARRRR